MLNKPTGGKDFTDRQGASRRSKIDAQIEELYWVLIGVPLSVAECGHVGQVRGM